MDGTTLLPEQNGIKKCYMVNCVLPSANVLTTQLKFGIVAYL